MAPEGQVYQRPESGLSFDWTLSEAPFLIPVSPSYMNGQSVPIIIDCNSSQTKALLDKRYDQSPHVDLLVKFHVNQFLTISGRRLCLPFRSVKTRSGFFLEISVDSKYHQPISVQVKKASNQKCLTILTGYQTSEQIERHLVFYQVSSNEWNFVWTSDGQHDLEWSLQPVVQSESFSRYSFGLFIRGHSGSTIYLFALIIASLAKIQIFNSFLFSFLFVIRLVTLATTKLVRFCRVNWSNNTEPRLLQGTRLFIHPFFQSFIYSFSKILYVERVEQQSRLN